MNSDTWKMWDGKHDLEDQRKRLTSAKKANMTPVSVDVEGGTGVFSGSTNYETSLSECTCIDFKKRKLPCKHMYRLAIELGILDETAKSDKAKIRTPKSERAALEPIIEIIETELSDSQRSLLRKIIGDFLYSHKGSFVIEKTPDCDYLISHGFVKVSDNVDLLLNGQQRYKLIERLENNNFSGFKKNTKTSELIKWIKENVADIDRLFPDLYVVGINSKFEGIQKKILTYLIRRDDIEEYYDPNDNKVKTIPKGAEFKISVTPHGVSALEINFPKDEITDLLNMYEKNRCIGWNK